MCVCCLCWCVEEAFDCSQISDSLLSQAVSVHRMIASQVDVDEHKTQTDVYQQWIKDNVMDVDDADEKTEMAHSRIQYDKKQKKRLIPEGTAREVHLPYVSCARDIYVDSMLL